MYMLTRFVRAGAVEATMWHEYGFGYLIADLATIVLLVICASVYFSPVSMRSVLENRLIATLSFVSSPIIGAYLGGKYLPIRTWAFEERAMAGGFTAMMLFLVWYFFLRPRPSRTS